MTDVTAPPSSPTTAPIPHRHLHLELGPTLLNLPGLDGETVFTVGGAAGFRGDVWEGKVSDATLKTSLLIRVDGATRSETVEVRGLDFETWSSRVRLQLGAQQELYLPGTPLVFELSFGALADMRDCGVSYGVEQESLIRQLNLALGGAAEAGIAVDADWIRLSLGVQGAVTSGVDASQRAEQPGKAELRVTVAPQELSPSLRPTARLTFNF